MLVWGDGALPDCPVFPSSGAGAPLAPTLAGSAPYRRNGIQYIEAFSTRSYVTEPRSASHGQASFRGRAGRVPFTGSIMCLR